MLTQPQTTYKKGDMATDRWQLAVRRWLQIQPMRAGNASQQSTVHARPTTVRTKSHREIEPQKAARINGNTAQKHVVIDSGNGTVESVCHAPLRCMTTHDKIKLCTFCFEPFPYIRDHAKYCGKECKHDAYLCRKAFGDGRAQTYLEELES